MREAARGAAAQGQRDGGLGDAGLIPAHGRAATEGGSAVSVVRRRRGTVAT